MKNYLISENTVALSKKGAKTIAYDVNKYQVINKSLKSILEENCLYYGSSLKGRILSAQKILNIKYKVPIFITENNVFLVLNSLRGEECLLIAVNKIVNYENCNGKLQISCVNKQIFTTNLSLYSFEKMLLNSFKLNNCLKWRNLTNLV